MKIVFNRQQLINTVAPMMCAAIAKSTNPFTEYILIKASADTGIVLTTYDLDKGVCSTVEGDVEEGGCFCIHANKLFQTLKVLEGENVTVITDPENCETVIRSGKAHYKMQALRGDEFPVLPTVSNTEGFEISAGRVRRMISKVIYAIGINDQRAVLNGAYFRITGNEIMAVACDSFKLAKSVCRTEIKNLSATSEKYQYIVPQKNIADLFKLLPEDEEETVIFRLSRKCMVCSFSGITFYSRLIEGEYIDFERIIIKNHKISAILDKSCFLACLDRAAVVTEEKVPGSTKTPLKFTLEGNVLKLSAVSSAGVSYDEMEAEHEGEDIVISFNNRHLIDSVRACTGEKIRIELSTPLYSINIVPVEQEENCDDIFFMMPVRTRN